MAGPSAYRLNSSPLLGTIKHNTCFTEETEGFTRDHVVVAELGVEPKPSVFTLYLRCSRGLKALVRQVGRPVGLA